MRMIFGFLMFFILPLTSQAFTAQDFANYKKTMRQGYLEKCQELKMDFSKSIYQNYPETKDITSCGKLFDRLYSKKFSDPMYDATIETILEIDDEYKQVIEDQIRELTALAKKSEPAARFRLQEMIVDLHAALKAIKQFQGIDTNIQQDSIQEESSH